MKDDIKKSLRRTRRSILYIHSSCRPSALYLRLFFFKNIFYSFVLHTSDPPHLLYSRSVAPSSLLAPSIFRYFPLWTMTIAWVQEIQAFHDRLYLNWNGTTAAVWRTIGRIYNRCCEQTRSSPNRRRIGIALWSTGTR